ELHVEPFVFEEVPHVRDRRRGRAELEDAQTVVYRFADTSGSARPWLNDRDRVIARTQAARQLVRAPAAAAADRRKCIGGQEDVHRAVSRLLRPAGGAV